MQYLLRIPLQLANIPIGGRIFVAPLTSHAIAGATRILDARLKYRMVYVVAGGLAVDEVEACSAGHAFERIAPGVVLVGVDLKVGAREDGEEGEEQRARVHGSG